MGHRYRPGRLGADRAERDYGSVEALLDAHNNVSRRALELAQAYHTSHPEEIDEKIADNRRPLSELRDLYPFAGFAFAAPDD